MKYVGYAACAALLACAWTVGCGNGEPAAESPSGAAVVQKTCPVMGGPIDKTIFVDYKGRRVYFCCAACKEAFGKEPEKYIAKVDEELKKKAE